MLNSIIPFTTKKASGLFVKVPDGAESKTGNWLIIIKK